MKCFAQSYLGDRWQGWNLNPGRADSEVKMTFELVLKEKLEFISERKEEPRAFLVAQRHKNIQGV